MTEDFKHVAYIAGALGTIYLLLQIFDKGIQPIAHPAVKTAPDLWISEGAFGKVL